MGFNSGFKGLSYLCNYTKLVPAAVGTVNEIVSVHP